MAAKPVASAFVNRFLSLVGALVGALAILASACGAETPHTTTAAEASASDDSPAAAAGEGAQPEWPHTFVVDQIDGATFDAGDYAGQDLVLWFWAPW